MYLGDQLVGIVLLSSGISILVDNGLTGSQISSRSILVEVMSLFSYSLLYNIRWYHREL
jgi:hypothetical protein